MADDESHIPFPYPGELPRKPPPIAGDIITFEVEGWPPFKGGRTSLRNPHGKHYQRFLDLRLAATRAMNGRCWYEGMVKLSVRFLFPDRTWPDVLKGDWPLPYVSGIMDTIDGSHGKSFTYLPIIIQDDSQVEIGGWYVLDSECPMYEVQVEFLG